VQQKETFKTQFMLDKNSQEIWGGVPAVLLFGNDYQLWPVIEEGAIQGYSKMTTMTTLTPSNKQTAAQLSCQWGTYLFIHIMTESVFFLEKNTESNLKSS
jgi:hypothetical protein